MMELRWAIVPGWDGPEKQLQYRVKYDATIRAAVAGMWSNEDISQTATDWINVPEVNLCQPEA